MTVADGKHRGGRKPGAKSLTAIEKAEAVALWQCGASTIEDIAKRFKKRPETFSRLFSRLGIKKGSNVPGLAQKFVSQIENGSYSIRRDFQDLIDSSSNVESLDKETMEKTTCITGGGVPFSQVALIAKEKLAEMVSDAKIGGYEFDQLWIVLQREFILYKNSLIAKPETEPETIPVPKPEPKIKSAVLVKKEVKPKREKAPDLIDIMKKNAEHIDPIEISSAIQTQLQDHRVLIRTEQQDTTHESNELASIDDFFGFSH